MERVFSSEFGYTFNVLHHEAGHAYDDVIGNASSSAEFKKIWAIEKGPNPMYQGEYGPREYFADSFDRIFGKDQGFIKNHPLTAKYFNSLIGAKP